MKKLWNRLFLEERPSFSLSLFRVAVAFTVGAHVVPSLMRMADNYYPGAFKEVNPVFFPEGVLAVVARSPVWLIDAMAALFMAAVTFFFFGLWSQLSCIVLTLTCYYFYALNSFHVGTLSWDILLVTMFLMCLTGYHGDYFSADCLRRADEFAYKKQRPFFIQRLLQMQVGFTYFYTALVKVYPEGNWITDNPIYSIMNYPVSGTTKTFLIRDFLMDKPGLCYGIGLGVVVTELLMIFLLFWRKTRVGAIYLGFIFHITLLLTLDVPAMFFFLFPPQLLLFIDPREIVGFIEQRREYSRATRRHRLVYDGHCQFCVDSVRKIKTMDLLDRIQCVDPRGDTGLSSLHLSLTKELALSRIYLVDVFGRLTGGFFAFRRLCFICPMLFPLIPLVYFPGMGVVGSAVYSIIAKNRYFLRRGNVCRSNACGRPTA
jgi:predicted DCC family thiol-disulfide oxidoreductase YuxK